LVSGSIVSAVALKTASVSRSIASAVTMGRPNSLGLPLILALSLLAGRLSQSLLAYVGHPAYRLDDLRTDLDNVAFLLGGDGKNILGEDPA
jgi:predicted ABC-type sugar transport system permease subunit